MCQFLRLRNRQGVLQLRLPQWLQVAIQEVRSKHLQQLVGDSSYYYRRNFHHRGGRNRVPGAQNAAGVDGEGFN